MYFQKQQQQITSLHLRLHPNSNFAHKAPTLNTKDQITVKVSHHAKIPSLFLRIASWSQMHVSVFTHAG